MSRSADPRKVGDVLDAIMKMAEENKFQFAPCQSNLKFYSAPEVNQRDDDFFALSLFINKFVPQDSTNDVAVSIYSLLCRRPTNSIRASFKKTMEDDAKESASMKEANLMKKIFARLCHQ